MKVLWIGDAVVSTGFARCTHAACDALHSAGHEVSILGINYCGDPHDYPYSIYPCVVPWDGGRDGFGITRLPIMIDRLKPDIIVLLNDPWNISSYFESIDDYKLKLPVPPIVAWLAVDAKNQNGAALNRLSHAIVWTQFAIDELRAGGYTGVHSIIPLGVDHDQFFEEDKQEARKLILPTNINHNSDSFIIGVVGRNQPRKRLDLTIQYFAKWIHNYNINNVYLFMHVAPTGDRGTDISSLVKYHKIEGKVIVARPHMGQGITTDNLRHIYNCFDVLLTTTQGEGWGLPTLEAMACGVPCIVPNWSALGDDGWTGGAVVKVPCTSTAITAPINSWAYTIGGIADKEITIEMIDKLYRDAHIRNHFSQAGVNLAKSFSWQETGERMVKLLEQIHLNNNVDDDNLSNAAAG